VTVALFLCRPKALIITVRTSCLSEVLYNLHLPLQIVDGCLVSCSAAFGVWMKDEKKIQWLVTVMSPVKVRKVDLPVELSQLTKQCSLCLTSRCLHSRELQHGWLDVLHDILHH
jgi:hypothetical protein